MFPPQFSENISTDVTQNRPRSVSFPLFNIRILDFIQHNSKILIFLFLLIIWYPSLFLRMAGGFQINDYFGSFIDEYMLGHDYLQISALFRNVQFNTLRNGFHFRPAWAFIMEGMLIWFPGNYSFQFFIKIIMNAAVVFLSYSIVLHRTESIFLSILCAVFIIVHPSPVNLYLYSSEAFFQFFLILMIWWMSVPLDVWSSIRSSRPIAVLNYGQNSEIVVFHPYFIAMIAVLAFIGIAGSKEFGFLISEMLCLCLVVFLAARYRAFVASGVLLVVSVVMAVFCVYRVHEVRGNLIRLLDYTPPVTDMMFWKEFVHRILEGFIYLSPLQINSRMGKLVCIFILGLFVLFLCRAIKSVLANRLTLSWIIRCVFSLEAVLIVAILSTIILSSVPSGYPQRMTPRYVVPAVAPAAILIAIAWYEIWPKACRVILVFTAFLFLAAPNVTYQRDLDWALYNQSFSTYINLLKSHQQRGDKIIVDIEGEIGNSVVNFFGFPGQEMFGIKLSAVSQVDSISIFPARSFVASQLSPILFRSQSKFAKNAVIERIEVVKYNEYHGSGMDHVVRAWSRIGRFLGGFAHPYYESATVEAEPGPPFYLYTICMPEINGSCGADVYLKARVFGDFCKILESSSNNFGVTSMDSTEISVLRAGSGDFTIPMAIEADKQNDMEVVSLGDFTVESSSLAYRVNDAKGDYHSVDSIATRPGLQHFARSFSMRHEGGLTKQVEIYTHFSGQLSATLKCPSLVIGLPIEIVQPEIAYGSFMP